MISFVLVHYNALFLCTLERALHQKTVFDFHIATSRWAFFRNCSYQIDEAYPTLTT